MTHTAARPPLCPRAAELFARDLDAQRTRVSRMFVWLMVAQWIGAIAAAWWVSPSTWIGERQQVHEHVWMALILGGLLSALPILMALRAPTSTLTRHTIAVVQILYSALLIHLTGGRVETHFHIFGSLAFLAFYRDWRVLVTATVVVAADHYLRGVYLPLSVFGTSAASSWRWVEHAAWVVFEDIVLFAACAQSVREMQALAAERAQLERSRDNVEAQVRDRTAELTRAAAALRERETEIRSARDLAEAASRAKSEFLANMSHEIRTPMGAILGFVDLLADPTQTPEQRAESAQIIRRNGEHLLRLINDILDISRIEAGRMTVEALDCDPAALAEQAFSLMNVRALAKGLDLQLKVEPNVPWVRTDPLRLRQILVNIVGNAVKFTERGTVQLAVGASPEPDGRCTLRFDIHDTGIGMTEEQMSRLFTAFSQADGSMSRRFGGSGLGLMISRRLAQMLGGDISVTSQPGHGSVFSIRLTCDVGAPIHTAAPDMAASPDILRGRRILLAEDGPDNQRLIGFLLRRAGAEVEIAGNGRIAVDRALASAAGPNPFALILMDMQMPELDGYAAATLLRDKGWTGPIVALTAHAMAGDRERCVRAGCDDYLTKPVDRALLIATCAKALAAATAIPAA